MDSAAPNLTVGTEADVPDIAALMNAGVLDLIHASADEIEHSRRLPDAVVAALRGTGINRLLIPAALGGMEAPITDVMDVMERIAAVDGSAGWCAAIGAGSNVFAGYMPATGAGTVFADPDQGNATMFAPVGRMVSDHGRATLSGRWPFTSNCLHSAWVGLGALFHEADEVDPVPRIVFVPVADLTIEDTWDVVGLRGTGSHHVAAAEVAGLPGPVRSLRRPAVARRHVMAAAHLHNAAADSRRRPARHRPGRRRRGFAAGARRPHRPAGPIGRRADLDGRTGRRRHATAGGPRRIARRGR